ncbi:hypothetical protein ACWGNR_07735 [Streptomyces althioticus]
MTIGDQMMLRGWWETEATARRKWLRWVGEHGDRPGARITLTDEESGTALTQWPDP